MALPCPIRLDLDENIYRVRQPRSYVSPEVIGNSPVTDLSAPRRPTRNSSPKLQYAPDPHTSSAMLLYHAETPRCPKRHQFRRIERNRQQSSLLPRCAVIQADDALYLMFGRSSYPSGESRVEEGRDSRHRVSPRVSGGRSKSQSGSGGGGGSSAFPAFLKRWASLDTKGTALYLYQY